MIEWIGKKTWETRNSRRQSPISRNIKRAGIFGAKIKYGRANLQDLREVIRVGLRAGPAHQVRPRADPGLCVHEVWLPSSGQDPSGQAREERPRQDAGPGVHPVQLQGHHQKCPGQACQVISHPLVGILELLTNCSGVTHELFWSYSRIVLELLTNCPRVTLELLKLLSNCSRVTLELFSSYSRIVLELLLGCSRVTLEMFSSYSWDVLELLLSCSRVTFEINQYQAYPLVILKLISFLNHSWVTPEILLSYSRVRI